MKEKDPQLPFTKTSMRTRNMPPDPCPICGHQLDSANTGFNDTPRPGDVSVCYYCGHLAMFGPTGKLEHPPEAEILATLDEPTRAHVENIRDLIFKKGFAA